MDFVPVFRGFDLGFRSDVSRDELPQNAAYRMRDWLLPQHEAPERKRGGWSYGSPDLSSLGGSAASVPSLGFLPFASDGHLVAVSDSGFVYQVKQFDGGGGSLMADTGDTAIVPTWPVFYMKTGTFSAGIILGGYGQTHRAPKKYYDTGTLAYAVAALGGTPPHARVGWQWGDYLVLANYYDPTGGTFDLKNYRLAFGPVGAPESAWVLTGASASTFDFPEEVVAGIPLLNTQLIFGYGNTYSLTGDTPPPGGNLTRRLLFQGNGAMDGRSVKGWRNYAVWANSSGVWLSDGATGPTDLTAAGGISTYYRQQVAGFSTTQGWTATADIYRDHYILVIRNAAGAFVTCLVCDLARKVWAEWTNIPATNFAHFAAGSGTALYTGQEELFFGNLGSPRVGRLSSLWTPGSSFSNDADGTAVLPVLETGYYVLGGNQKKRIRSVYVTYDMRAAGGVSPTLAVAVTFGPENGAPYTTLAQSLPTTTAIARKHAQVRRSVTGMGLRFTQVGISSDTRIYSGEIEGFPQLVTR